jgi:lysophospholipase L1-like esterase
MHRLKILTGALALALLLAGSAFAVDTGSANFTTYVALGDSLTAGYVSSALTRTYQVNSYPALIYRQATGQTTGFEQPLISDPGISGLAVCNGANPPAPCGILRLAALGVSPTIVPTPGRGVPVNLNLPRPYNNMAVPGQTLHQLLTQTTGGFADVVLRQTGFTQLQQGLSLKPTFVTLWIGNNDALGAAVSGIAIGGVTLTPVESFQADYTTVVNAIAATGAKMAFATIPDVTSIPYVNTVSRFIVNPQTGQPVRDSAGNPIPFIGPNGPLQAGDFVLLGATTEISQGRGIPTALGGSGLPLSDTSVLSAAEVATIRDYVNNYNAIITKAASDKGAALVDINALFKGIATNGLHLGGITYTSAFLTGGLFSYDGVHPTAFGYAYIANTFIDAINAKFGGDIPPVDLYPFVFGPLPKSLAKAADDDGSLGVLFTRDARLSLLKSLGVPQSIIDGKIPRKPRGRHN